MDIIESQTPTGCYLKITRSLDRTSVMDLEKALRLLWERQEGPIFLDIAELQSIDSAGLTIFLQWHRKALAVNRRFALVRPNTFHLKLFEITRMEEELFLLDDIDGKEIRFEEHPRD